MRQRKYVETATTQNRDSSSNQAQIGNIFIRHKCRSDQVILILDNRGENVETIDIYYKETGKVQKELRGKFQVPCSDPQEVPLLKGFEKWERLSFQVGAETRNVSNATLKKLADTAKKQRQIQPSHYQTEPPTPRVEQSDNFSATSEKSSNPSERSPHLTNPKTGKEVLTSGSSNPTSYTVTKRVNQENDALQIQQWIDLQSEIAQVKARLEQLVPELKTEIENLKKQNEELTKESSEHKAALDELKAKISGNPEQVFREAANHVLQMTFGQQEQTTVEILHNPNQICEMVKAELEKFKERLGEQENHTVSVVYQQLAKVEELIKFGVSEISPLEEFRENQAKQLAELVLADEPPNEIRYLYLGEIGNAYWEELKAYRSKLPQALVEIQSILDRIVILLVDGFSPFRAHDPEEVEVARSFHKNCLPNILQIMDLELVPIEIGHTDADARTHDIQDTQRGAFKPGVVADIIQHGVRRISDKQIIRKPVVMRGEPE